MPVEITMKIAKFHMDLMFGVMPVNGNPAAPISKCCRTNIFNNLNIEDNNFAQTQEVLSGNSVGKAMGMSLPVTAPARVSQLKDIMTTNSQNTVNTQIENVEIASLQNAANKIIGSGNTRAIQVDQSAGKLIRVAMTGSTSDKTAYKNALAGHMAYFLSGGNFGTQNTSNFTDPTNSNIERLQDNTDTANIIEQLIIQANNAGKLNRLFGATSDNGTIVPDLVSGNNKFYFLHFQIGDILTFKNTVDIGDNNNVIVLFKLLVTDDTDNSLNQHKTLGPDLGLAMNA
tara:strand:- start:1763 stop:2620 length:858 start_codon:yes stop_codon:yes gene_type:complete